MPLVSFSFAIFAILTVLVYFLMPGKYRWTVLLAASVIFYASYGVKYLVYLAWTVGVSFLGAGRIESINAETKRKSSEGGPGADDKRAVRAAGTARKRRLLAFIMLMSMGLWAMLKYGNFLIGNINALLSLAGLGWQAPGIPLAVPLGMSFYVFTAAGYLTDIYRGKYAAERNIAKYALFVGFFGHIVEGPFSRYDRLSPTLFAGGRFDYDRLLEGLRRMLWGVFKKTVIADPVGIAVSTVIGSGGEGFSGAAVLFAAVLYGVQIYADFSGYMDIVCGLCRVMGVQLEENFRRPYFSGSVEEFWKRWHITLGAWFRDYLFYPVSMGKTAQRLGRSMRSRFGAEAGKLVPGYFALIFVWTATGLWHGAAWRYLIWGWLNLAVIVCSMHLSGSYDKWRAALHISGGSRLWRLFAVVRTYLLICAFRAFSISPSVHAALSMFGRLFTSFTAPSLEGGIMSLFTGLEPRNVIAALAGTLALLTVDILEENGKWESVKASCPMPLRHVAMAALIFSVVLFAGQSPDLTGSFIYAHF